MLEFGFIILFLSSQIKTMENPEYSQEVIFENPVKSH